MSDYLKRPDFTEEQITWISWMVGEWYLAWKPRIGGVCTKCDIAPTHQLGRAKEHLKALLSNDTEFFSSVFPFYQLKEDKK